MNDDLAVMDDAEISDEILILKGWAGVEELYIRKEPSESGEVVGSFSFNEEIAYSVYDNDWLLIQYNEESAYVRSKYILDEDAGYESYSQYILDKVIGFTSYDAPATSGFKSFMDYRTITSTSSKQYRLQSSYAKTGSHGIRMVNDRYCVAVGSRFASDIGQYLDLILENGVVIPCVLADQKADVHTDSMNAVTMHNGCMSEFIVDEDNLSSMAKQYGDISQCETGWNSPVVQVKVYNKSVFDE